MGGCVRVCICVCVCGRCGGMLEYSFQCYMSVRPSMTPVLFIKCYDLVTSVVHIVQCCELVVFHGA